MAINGIELSPTQTDVKPPVASEVLSSVDLPPARKIDFPRTPEQFRQALGLSGERPAVGEDSFAEKEARVRSFVKGKQAEAVQSQFANDRGADLSYEDSSIQTQLSDQSLKTRIWRAYTTKRLNMFGLKHGSQILHAIESSVPIHNKKELNPKLVASLIKSLDPVDEQAALAKFNLAIERARRFCFLPRGHDFKNNETELIETIGSLANIPEDVFSRIEQQFKGRTQVLYHPGSFSGSYTIRANLLPIIKQGGLTPKQLEMLDKAVVWRQFSDALPLKSATSDSTEDRNYSWWVQSADLSDPNIVMQFDKFYPYLLDWADDRLPEISAPEGGSPPSRHSWDEENGRDFTSGLLHLDSTGQLGKLDMLIKNGWDCEGIYRKMKDGPAELDKALNEAVVFQSDPIKMGWVKALSEYYFKDARLPATGIGYYREMLENKDSLINIALILNALPNTEDFKPHEFLVHEGAVIGLDRYKFDDYLGQLLGRETLAETDRTVIQGIQNLFKTQNNGRYNLPKALSLEDLNLYSYLLINKDRIAGQIKSSYGHFDFDAVLLNELYVNNILINGELLSNNIHACHNQEMLSPDLQMHYFDFLNNQNRVLALNNLPAEYLAKMDQETQLMVSFFRKLNPSLQNRLAIGGKKLISECLANGKPTLAFMEYALSSGFFEEAKPLFTSEVIENLTPEKREFFQAVWSLPPEVALLMSHRASEWSSYFVSGKPTSNFLRILANLGHSGEFDSFLNSVDLIKHLPSQEREFWHYYKIQLRQSPNTRAYLLKMQQDRFGEFVVQGKPTAAFLDDLAKNAKIDVIREILPSVRKEDLTEDQQKFWSFYPQVDNLNYIRYTLLINKDRFVEFIEDGKPTLAFLNFASSDNGMRPQDSSQLRTEILATIDWAKLPQEEKVFWEYCKENWIFEDFLIKNKTDFSLIVADGQEKPLFYQKLIKESPRIMLELSRYKEGLSAGQYQNLWRMALGKEAIDQFLAALPKATDEARNAFTGNDYDRTSQFLKYLLEYNTPIKQEGLTAGTLPVITAFVEKFGLAKNETLYKYFHNLYLFEHQKIDELSSEMKDLGLDSTDQMIQKLAEVRRMVFGSELRNADQLRSLTAFQIQMLANVTRYDSARFGAGNAEGLGYKVNQFIRELEQSGIPDIPPGYEAETIESSGVKIEFKPEAVKENYAVLRQEILESIDKPASLEQLRSEAKDVIERKIVKINQILSKVTNEKQATGITRDLQNYQSYLNKLNGITDQDSLVLALLGMNFSGEERAGGEGFRGIDSLMRRIILTKLYQRHHDSPGFQENVRIKLSQDEVTAEGIDEIILTVDEMIKNHVLNLDLKNKEKYWQSEVFESILSNEGLRKNFRRIMEKFNPHIDKLRQEQANFIRTQTGAISQVKIIPDRGLVGEMAGYLADVCYVRVDDLLKSYSGIAPERPLVVPYKFVIDDPKSNDPGFVGSVLVFEVQTAKGEPALLVRALDIPNESEIDVSRFTENLLDKFAGVAARRGKKKVLVAGTGGTISNYTSITNHVLNSYVRGKEAEPVSPKFDFNQYNITNEIYVARNV